LADAQFEDEQGDCAFDDKEIRVKDWYLYWIDLKEKTVRPNTHRNYRERYLRNIDPVIGKMKLKDVKPFACQQIMNRMAEQGYTSSTIYQARIALFNMFDYAVQNDVIIKNPCNKTVKANIGKEVSKKEALTIEQQKKFLYGIKGNAYENQYAFLLQTGLRTGEMVGLRWSDIDFEKRILHVNQTMEYRYNVGEWRVGPPKS
jgi:integrase